MVDFLLLEDGVSYLLYEGQPEVDGGRIVLQDSVDPPSTDPIFIGDMWFPSGEAGVGSAYNLDLVADWSIDSVDPSKVNVRFQHWSAGDGGTTMDHCPIVTFDRQAFELAKSLKEPYSNDLSTTFDGSTEYLDTVAPAQGAGFGPVTINAWIKTTDTDGCIFGSKTNPPNFFWGIQGSRLTLSNTSGNFQTAVDAGSFRDGNWHMVTMSNDPNQNERVFIDGVEFTWEISSGNIGDIFDANGWYFARRLTSDYYAGNMDEVSIFDAELSPAQITELYNSGEPDNLLEHSQVENLIAWFRMGDIDEAPNIYNVVSGFPILMVNMDNGNFVNDVPT